MKVTILQNDIYWSDISANTQHVDEIMDKADKADLYVLPEMFSTGFCTHPEGIADKNGSTLAWMRKKAAEKDAAIAGSIAVEEDGKFYNRFHFVYPEGKVVCYNKKHLFTYGGEDKRFTPGNERVIAEYKGVRILLQICYDLRFPVFSRNRNDYDVAIYVASWPTPRVEAWKALLKARAIENQCYVLAVNRVGSDPFCQYCGGSAVIDPYGKIVSACEDGKECIAVADIDMKELLAFREKFPVLEDADSFKLD